ncbi:MAG TPA: methionine adenosyltransferase [Desulfuromonadales bacterium]|nr:methionine adenosyltransferase [Desulfuromonadales bacterium]
MVVVETYQGKAVNEQTVEIVERKGTGHPDTMCDAIMDAISVALSKAYLAEFGKILHHNVDKSLLAAGRVERWFGGGRVVRPMELIIGDRATFAVGGRTLPVGDIAVATARQWVREHLRFVDPERHLHCRVVLAPGSEELADIFQRPGRVRVANDTSAAIGYYPLSPTEQAVLELERYLNSPVFKNEFPESGEDVKVMGLRRNRDLDLTVAMPLLAAHIPSERAYFERKGDIREAMQLFVKRFASFDHTEIHFNALDEVGRGLGGTYLSLLGTSAEDADSGQVGRGNRVNGLIAMNRPMGTEAAAGKNPVSHVGKIYSVLAHRLARQIYERIDGLKEVYVLLLSRIGTPVDSPVMATAQVLLEDGQRLSDIRWSVEQIFAVAFAELDDFCRRLGEGEFPVC